LSLYWLADPKQPVVYARAWLLRQRRQTADTVARLRDGAFAAAGLDYATELASWIGPEAQPGPDCRRPGGCAPGLVVGPAEPPWRWRLLFLQRFWQTRSLTGTDLQISTYRGMGLISSRGALVGPEGSTQVPLATALINDDLVLLASGRRLQQALDVSQIDALNQGATPQFQQGLQQLGPGFGPAHRPAEAWA
jgi:hypothetical protein